MILFKNNCDEAICSLVKGDINGLTVIYEAYGRIIYSVAFQIVNNASDAEDVLQDTMLRILKQAHNYRKGSNPKAWIMSITRSCAIDKLNSKYPSVPIDEMEKFSLENGLFAELNEEQILICDALKTLSNEELLIVKLKIYVGLSHKEIASVLKISVVAVRKRYQRAIDKLKEYFT